MEKKYFFINSNICFPGDDLNFDKFIYNISGNTGNSYITYSIIKTLYGKFQKVDDIKNLWFYKPNQYDIDRINNEYSKVILVLQDNLRLFDSYLEHNIYEGLAGFFSKIKIPVVVFSLGSNSFDGQYSTLHQQLNKDLVNFIKVIADKTVSFGVHGQYTIEILKNLGINNVDAIGCPSYFETGRDRVIKKKPLGADFKVLSGGDFENSKVQNVHYVLQDEKLFMKAMAFDNERILRNDFERFDPTNSYGKNLIRAYAENNMSVFADMDEWREFDKNFDFYIGSRVHGGIMALNAGLPAIITNQDSRAREMAALFGVECSFIDKDANLREVYNSLDVDKINNNYNQLYDNYCSWLNKNGLWAYDASNKNSDNTSLPINPVKFSCNFNTDINGMLLDRAIEAQKVAVAQVQGVDEINILIQKIDLLLNSKTKKWLLRRSLKSYIANFVCILVFGKKNRKAVRDWFGK